MNYKIITDEDELQRFVDWLPETKENEQYYMCLFARKKYIKDLEHLPNIPHIRSDKAQLKRMTSTKDRIIDKIRQLECPVGSFKAGEHPAPQESLALYISTNPRDLWRATVRTIGQLAKVLEGQGKNSNPHAEAMSEIQKCAGTRHHVAFDIDEKDENILDECIGYVDGHCRVLETRGGYHLFVDKSKIPEIKEKMWHQKIAKYSDQTGDLMSPVGGTFQGGHSVKFIR